MKIYNAPVRGRYLKAEGGRWALERAASHRRPYRDQEALPASFRFEAGSLIPEHPSYPVRVRLGCGPLDTLGVGHIVHLLQGVPSWGTLYAYHRGEEVMLQLCPSGADRSNPQHMGRAFYELVAEHDERAAGWLLHKPYPASVPVSDDLPALYAAFAR